MVGFDENCFVLAFARGDSSVFRLVVFSFVFTVFYFAFSSAFASALSFSSSSDAGFEAKASAALVAARADVDELRSLNLHSAYAEDLLAEAQRAFDGEDPSLLLAKAKYLNSTGDARDARAAAVLFEEVFSAQERGVKINANYSLAVEKANAVRAFKRSALSLYSELENLAFDVWALNSSPYDLSGVFESQALAREAFRAGRLAEASLFINETRSEIDGAAASYSYEQARELAARNNADSFVRENLSSVLVVLGGLAVAAFAAYFALRRASLKRRLYDLELERATSLSLLKKNQENYFVKESVSKTAFESRAARLKKRVLEIDAFLPVLRGELKKGVFPFFNFSFSRGKR